MTWVIDFETFYSIKDKYRLKTLTAFEYITDPRFEVQLLSVRPPQGGVLSFVGDDEIREFFQSQDWSDKTLVAHNGAGFDFLIAAWRYGVKPKRWVDTLVMWRRLRSGPFDLAQVAKDLDLEPKGTALTSVDGLRLQDIPPDTLAAFVEYCKHDTVICAAAYEWALPLMREEDMIWMDLCVRMATESRLRFDVSELDKGILKEKQRQDDLKVEVGLMLAQRGIILTPKDWAAVRKCDGFLTLRDAIMRLVRSDKRLAHILETLGYEVPMKISPAKGEPVPAFGKKDEPFASWVDHADPFLAAVAECRMAVKSTINLSRLARFKELAHRMDGDCPIFLRPMGAGTGRNTGAQKLNFQNVSARPSRNNPDGKKNALRKSIIAPPGYVVLDCDSSQVEVRVNGAISGEPAILDVFSTPNADPYCIFASEHLYHREIIKGRDTRERDVSKSAVLGNGYGQGPAGFQKYCADSGIYLSLEEAAHIVQVYRRAHPYVTNFWAESGMALTRMLKNTEPFWFGHKGCCIATGKSVILPSGRPLHYWGLRRGSDDDAGAHRDALFYYDGVKRKWRKIYPSLLAQNIIQAAAADIIHGQAVTAWKELGLRPSLQVHDSLVYVVPEDEAEQAKEQILEIMSRPPEWLPWVPLAAEGGYGRRYSDV